VKQLLELLGASVTGPAATTAAAKSLLAQSLPDVSIALGGGERSDGLIAQLRKQGVLAILLSGFFRISHTVIVGWAYGTDTLGILGNKIDTFFVCCVPVIDQVMVAISSFQELAVLYSSVRLAADQDSLLWIAFESAL
jgi:hypothetical protein